MKLNIKNDAQAINVPYTQAASGVYVGDAKTVAFQSLITVNTPSAATFTADASTEVCTAAAHGMKTGLIVRVSTTTTLPAGLSGATDYFVIYVSADTFKLATSLANAQAGTAIDITSAGTGTHTITPTALAGCIFKLQGSLDDSTYIDLAGTSESISASTNLLYTFTDPAFEYIRGYFTLTTGQLSVAQTILTKGA